MDRGRRAFLWRSAALAAPLLLSRGLGLPEASAQAVGRPAQSVRDHGARGDSQTLDTRALQAAIDTAGSYRGVVYFPPRAYISGTLRLRRHTTVHLAAGTTLIANRTAA